MTLNYWNPYSEDSALKTFSPSNGMQCTIIQMFPNRIRSTLIFPRCILLSWYGSSHSVHYSDSLLMECVVLNTRHNNVFENQARHSPATVLPGIVCHFDKFTPELEMVISDIHFSDWLHEFAVFEQMAVYTD